MSNIVEKLDSYQILTNLLPGAFFGVAMKLIYDISFPIDSICEEILVYYFIGLIINRIGSLVVKPMLIKIKFINEASYSDYLKALKKDAKLDILSEVNNFFRSLLTCFMLFPILDLLRKLVKNVEWIKSSWKGAAIVFLILLFLFSYRKQTNILRKRVEAINSQQEEMI